MPISKIKKKKTCYCKWRIEDVVDRMNAIEKLNEYLRDQMVTVKPITIYSANADETCIGQALDKWHRIVCQYEGNICLGGPRPHWQSTWDVDEKGFHLRSMHDHLWKGWFGQYRPDNQMKYDELPRDVLAIHHKVITLHIQSMAVYYPCHIYNDFTGDMYRP